MDLNKLEREFQKDLTKQNPLAAVFGVVVVFLLGATLVLVLVGALLWAWNFVASSLSAL